MFLGRVLQGAPEQKDEPGGESERGDEQSASHGCGGGGGIRKRGIGGRGAIRIVLQTGRWVAGGSRSRRRMRIGIPAGAGADGDRGEAHDDGVEGCFAGSWTGSWDALGRERRLKFDPFSERPADELWIRYHFIPRAEFGQSCARKTQGKNVWKLPSRNELSARTSASVRSIRERTEGW